MSFSLAAVAVSAKESTEKVTEHANHLPMPAWAFGVIALVILVSLLLITSAFKSVGTRHD